MGFVSSAIVLIGVFFSYLENDRLSFTAMFTVSGSIDTWNFIIACAIYASPISNLVNSTFAIKICVIITSWHTTVLTLLSFHN